MKNVLLFVAILFSFQSCIDQEEPDFFISGLSPVYSTLDISEIKSLPPTAIKDAGNLLLYQNWLFIVERFRGIHVFDNSNPEHPENVSFINIPGVSQLTLDSNILFVNFGMDLILLDVSDILDVKVVNKITGFYEDNNDKKFPENYSGYFDCVDESQGAVVAWERKELINPKCFR